MQTYFSCLQIRKSSHENLKFYSVKLEKIVITSGTKYYFTSVYHVPLLPSCHRDTIVVATCMICKITCSRAHLA